MLSLVKFNEAYNRVCAAFDRAPKPEQVDVFYDKLKYRFDTDIPAAVEYLLELRKAPTISDWIDSFRNSRKQNYTSTRPFGKCGRCKGSTASRVIDDEYYEVCMDAACGWRDRLYTLKEWKILHGLEGITELEKLTNRMAEQGMERT